MTFFNTFLKNDSGAITVDWVVLTAAVAGIGMAVVIAISSGTNDATVNINDDLNNAATNTSIVGAITGTAAATTGAAAQFLADAGGNIHNATHLMYDAAPAGFSYTSNIDNGSGNPIYTDGGINGAENYSIGGETIATTDYTAAGNTYTYDYTYLGNL